jgi:hypothetical protein
MTGNRLLIHSGFFVSVTADLNQMIRSFPALYLGMIYT